MGFLNQGSFRAWNDGETIKADEYRKERDLLITAINDTWEKFTAPLSITGAKIANNTIGVEKLITSSFGNESLNSLRIDKITDDILSSVQVVNGSQIVQGGEAPAIAQIGMRGRTLINILGDAGGMESLAPFDSGGATISRDSANKISGSNGLKLTLSAASGFGRSANRVFSITSTKYYLLGGWLKNGNSTEIHLRLSGQTALTQTPQVSSNSWTFAYRKFTGVPDATNHSFLVEATGANGQVAYADEVRIYELSAAEYAEIDTMTAEQIAARWPYVGTGIHGIRNPEVTSVRDNLLPPIHEWGGLDGGVSVNGPYDAVINATAATPHNKVITIPIIGGQTYTLSKTGNAYVYYYFRDANGRITDRIFGTATAPLNTVSAEFAVSNDTGATVATSAFAIGTFTVSNLVFMSGETVPEFKPQSKTKSRFNTEIHAMPGSVFRDEIYYVDGRPRREGNVKAAVLDGSLTWGHAAISAGMNLVDIPLPSGMRDGDLNAVYLIATKFDGKVLSSYSSGTGTDRLWTTGGVLRTSISNTDSGWGEGYTPTAGEIKAYFLGWKMYPDGSAPTTAYTTGTKSWKEREADGSLSTLPSTSTLTLPTAKAPRSIPYQLLYQLIKPEPSDVSVGGVVQIEQGENHVTASSEGAPVVDMDISYGETLMTAVRDAGKALSRLAERFTSAPEPWIEPTLLNGWSDYGGGYPKVSCYKGADGIVTVRGIVKGGATTDGTVLFILPLGYRPSHSGTYAAPTYNGSIEVVGRVQVTPNGNVAFRSVVAGTGNGFYSLDSIRFRAEG